jgi:hypothetical protein
MYKRPPVFAASGLSPWSPVLPVPVVASAVPLVASSVEAPPPASRQAIVRYVGFRATARGREYTMRVSDVQSSRDFVLLITHQAFADRETRFQDAPDVCSSKLRRELAADPGLLPGDGIAVTPQDLIDSRTSHLSSTEKRTRVKP